MARAEAEAARTMMGQQQAESPSAWRRLRRPHHVIASEEHQRVPSSTAAWVVLMKVPQLTADRLEGQTRLTRAGER